MIHNNSFLIKIYSINLKGSYYENFEIKKIMFKLLYYLFYIKRLINQKALKH